MGRRRAALEDLVEMQPALHFWKGRRVLLTGHTGFKGAWAAVWLKRLGATVTGFALPPETDPNLWMEIGDGLLEREFLNDLADRDALQEAVAIARPSVVLHMAAQARVRRSYADPVETFATNVMGTVNLLHALRDTEHLRAALIVTTDKVYANDDSGRDFTENDRLGGHDPYSASKAAAEMATASYAASFFRDRGVRIATARAGNVIGGGDWSQDRLIPDVWRAAVRGETLVLRNPEATRPWQHVIEPLAGYFLYLEALVRGDDVPDALNFGPLPGSGGTVADVAEAMGEALGAGAIWRRDGAPAPPEMTLLSLDPSRAIETLGWRPRLDFAQAVGWSAQWYSARGKGADLLGLCQSQIKQYEALT